MRVAKINARVLLIGFAVLPLLSACQELDLQGNNPQEYYAANPIETKVENRHALLSAEFDGMSQVLSDAARASLSDSLSNINKRAVDGISIHFPSDIKYNVRRIASIKGLLRKSGLDMPVSLVSDRNLEGGRIIIDISYVDVVFPDCPDWKKSPVTTYSNMVPANFGCSAAVNLGLMIDDPRDLVRGRDSRQSNTERSGKVISDFIAGTTPSSSSSSASSSSSSSSTGQ